MPGLTDFATAEYFNYITGQKTVPALPSAFLALFTTAPTSDAMTGGTEVSGNGYARQQVAGSLTTNATTASGNPTLHFAATVPSWIVAGMSIYDTTATSVIPANTTVISTTSTTVVMSANATGAGVGSGDIITFSAFAPPAASSSTNPTIVPGKVANTNTLIQFAQATGAGWGNVNSWGLYDALTSGNPRVWDFLGNYTWIPFTSTSASPGVITSTAHGFSNGDSIVVSTEFGGSLPATGGSWAGVLTVASVTTDTFTLGVNTTSTGDGYLRKVQVQSIPGNITPQFAANTFTIIG